MVASDTVTPAAVISGTPTPANVSINFDNLPEGVPPDWTILYAPFKAESQPPEVVKAQAQGNHFIIDNLGTFSGLYALYNGAISSSNLQISLDAIPDQGSAMGVFLVCRYSEIGWYQFRVSGGSSQIQYIQPQGKIFNTTTLTNGAGFGLDDGAHRLSAICNASQLTLLADGKEIISTQANLLSGGALGFGVEAFDKPGRKAFDNLEIQFFAPPGPTPSPTLTATLTQAATPTITTTPIPTATLTPAATPTITATPVPTAIPTLRPTVIPEDQLVLYQTEFDDKDETLANWKTFAYSFAARGFVTEGYEAFAVNGVYRIRTSNPKQGANLRIFSIYDADIGSSDVDISTRGKAPYYEGSMGLVCRYSEAGWYQFMVEPNGIWSIRLVKPDETGQFHFHTISSGGKWLGQKVDLRAECKGDRLTFYINGEKYASLRDSTFPSGKVGVLGWSFDIPGEIGIIDYFTARRAQWNETGLPGPAPTPGADGTIYSTTFAKLDDLNPYWAKVDIGIQGIPGSPALVGGPGQPSPHTYLYINDFDPGPDVEITADVRGEWNFPRGIFCRYSEDGWYEAFYMKDGPKFTRVALARAERDEQGQLTPVIINTYYPPTPAAQVNLTLTCAGNQISVKMNGKQVLYAEDNAWPTGRYGFLLTDNPPGNFRSNTLLNYTIRPAQAAKAGDVIYDETFDTPEKITAVFQVNLEDNRVHISENILQLAPDNNALHLFTTRKYENSEFHLAAEIQAKSSLNLHCRSDSAASVGAELHGNGDWNIVLRMKQMLANGNSPSIIQPGKNQFVLSCINDQVSLSANGQTLATVALPDYQPAIGANGFDVYEFSAPVLVSQVRLKALQSDVLLAKIPLLNQASIPAYQSGETIFAWDINALFYSPGWWGKENRPWNWTSWYRGENPPKREANQISIPSNKGATVFTYRPDLYDLRVEISAEVTLTSKGGGVGLFCHFTNGRYEFLLQPDGKWYIRRNTSYWGEPRAANITILANGVVENFQPQGAQVNAICNGSDLIFTLNGTELGRAQDDLYPEGQVGIFFDSFTAGSFTNLTLQRAK
jgi:hypothetical protein